MTTGEQLRAAADRLGIPLRTDDQVRTCLKRARKNGADVSMARLMLNHGRLTDEAREVARTWLEG